MPYSTRLVWLLAFYTLPMSCQSSGPLQPGQPTVPQVAVTETATAGECVARQAFGTFPVGRPDVWRLNTPKKSYMLRSPYTFTRLAAGVEVDYTAQEAHQAAPWVWNGSSLPKILEPIFGGRFTGCHALASIVHDYHYQRAVDHPLTRKEADRVFYWGTRANGLGLRRAQAMYFAIRKFGGKHFKRPDEAEEFHVPRSAKHQEDILEAARRYIAPSNRTLDDLDRAASDPNILFPYLPLN